jgi:hypothetical protein
MKKNIISIWLILFLRFSINCFAQQSNIDVTIHSRVDTTNIEVKEVAKLWISYLNSKPDSLYDNPFWNSAEKLKFKNFDFSKEYLYQLPSSQLLRYYKPTILSIEKEGDNYGIRTIFSADRLPEEYRNSTPWCNTKLFAIQENGKWKLKNALPIITEKWNKKTSGKITFIYPQHHKFNEELAEKANQFCAKISNDFNFSDWDPFDFYITCSGDELGKLLNFDFYFAGYTTGIGMNDNRILLSGLGSEFYPHEFIHLIVPKFDRHTLIEEGIATWKGGQGGKTFEESAKLFANELAKNDTIKFSDILNQKWGWQYAGIYTTGAIFCKAAYDKGGVNMLKKLLEIPNDDEKLIEAICKIFEIQKKEINSFWRKEILKFRFD